MFASKKSNTFFFLCALNSMPVVGDIGCIFSLPGHSGIRQPNELQDDEKWWRIMEGWDCPGKG